MPTDTQDATVDLLRDSPAKILAAHLTTTVVLIEDRAEVARLDDSLDARSDRHDEIGRQPAM